ncbi:GIY-YIG nuclease family protein [Jannaschia sp. KMU-145]|uniref:GIY-YIG nuclease family protein n=1 Tax=Jannaschia halovivens TaxID=3388667 RepID=UPI00396B36D5
MALFQFQDVFRHHGIDPRHTRLVRHDNRAVAALRTGGLPAFASFASIQIASRSPYKGATMAAQFLPGPILADGDVSALFLGVTRIIDRFPWRGDRLPRLAAPGILAAESVATDRSAYDLEWIDDIAPYSERLLIRWGRPNSARAWSQWADRNTKDIVELRRLVEEPPFPGFGDLSVAVSDLPLRPAAWHAALASVRGIYLLVAPDGSQYVGSATGADGILGRWLAYAHDGHGGNVMLQAAMHADYTASILEIASPADSPRDILAREAFWKRKLGTRAHGLNAN